jgi:hypothetical protein
MTDSETPDPGNKVFPFDKLKQKHGRPPAPNLDSTLPRLFADKRNPDKVVAELKTVLAASYEVFDRGMVVRVGDDANAGGVSAYPLDSDGLIVATHRVCRPYEVKEGITMDCGLPRAMAAMFLSYRDWGLPPLNGVATAPLLSADGSIRTRADMM